MKTFYPSVWNPLHELHGWSPSNSTQVWFMAKSTTICSQSVIVTLSQTKVNWPIWKDSGTVCTNNLIDTSTAILPNCHNQGYMVVQMFPCWLGSDSLPLSGDWLISHYSWVKVRNTGSTRKMVHSVPSETSQEECQKWTQPLLDFLWV
jgi:hypothetical protein